MNRNNCFLLLASIGLVSTTAVAVGPEPIELEETFVRIEINATDGDAGIHLFLDGTAWKEMMIIAPNGDVVADVQLTGQLAIQGLTEFFSESSEPSFDEQPLEEFLELFPPGTYEFVGMTIEDIPIVGDAELTHALPEQPVLLSPPLDVPVNLNSVVIAWEPVPDPKDSEIDGYEVIVEFEEGEFILQVEADVNAVAIPAALLDPESEYKFEVVAREESGNQVITEAVFTTSDDEAETCLGDINGDGEVNGADLGLLLGFWGGCR